MENGQFTGNLIISKGPLPKHSVELPFVLIQMNGLVSLTHPVSHFEPLVMSTMSFVERFLYSE